MCRQLTHEDFESRLYSINPDIEPVEQYTRMKDKILFRCKTCGNEWRTTPSSVLSGTSCPVCSRVRVTAGRRKTHEAFIEELAEKNPNVEALGKYRGGNARITVRCKVCGNEWEPRAQSLLKGYGCWECGKKKIGDARRKTHEEFVSQVADINPNIEVVGEYKGDGHRVLVRCNVCGNEWTPTAGGIIAGHGCVDCGKSSTSLTEQYILQGLRLVLGDGDVLHRDTAAVGVELDIYIPKHRVAIEPGGWHWHQDKLDIDANKRVVCSEAGVRLLTIFDNYKEETSPFPEDCLTYEYKLSAERGFQTLQSIVAMVLNQCGVSHDFTEKEWALVLRRARRHSARITTEEFTEKLATVNGRVIVRGKYLNNHTAIECECPSCGWRWSATPAHLLSGEACPSCAGTMKRTHESFVKMLAESNPSVEVIGKYTRAAARVEVKCRKCGHVWSPTANSLLQGSACPKCAAEYRASRRRLSDEEYRNALRKANPNIVLLGQYHNGTTPIKFECKICGTTWEQEPRLLICHVGYGCPVCTGRYHRVSNVVARNTLF